MLQTQFDISVVIATRDRAALLQQTLESLQQQQIGHLSLEVVIVDNGSSDNTQSVLSGVWNEFTLVRLEEPVAGKSRALNQALERVRGKLLAFTDDDVLSSPVWLAVLHSASIKYPGAQVFCGPVTPRFPPGTPGWMVSHPYLSRMFAAFDPRLPEGFLPRPWIPYGCNFAIRAEAVAQERFRLDLGPSLENGPMFHEDTEFIGRFAQIPGNIVFCPRAGVIHQITALRITFEYLCERSFEYGRAQVIATGRPFLIHKEVAAVHAGSKSDEAMRYERGTLINYYCGQQYQFEAMGNAEFERTLRRALDELEIDSNRDLLADSARKACLSGMS